MSLNHSAIHLALRKRLYTVAGIPGTANRSEVNKEFDPTTGTPYVEEEFVPAVAYMVSGPPDVGTMEARGLYVVHWWGLANTGAAAILAAADAILAKFTPGTLLPLDNGDVVRVRSDVAPTAGPVRQAEPGWAVCTINIPYWIQTRNN